MGDRQWVSAEYDYGYINGWVVLRRGADFKASHVETLPWKVYARVSDPDDARLIVARLRKIGDTNG